MNPSQNFDPAKLFAGLGLLMTRVAQLEQNLAPIFQHFGINPNKSLNTIGEFAAIGGEVAPLIGDVAAEAIAAIESSFGGGGVKVAQPVSATLVDNSVRPAAPNTTPVEPANVLASQTLNAPPAGYHYEIQGTNLAVVKNAS